MNGKGPWQAIALSLSACAALAGCSGGSSTTTGNTTQITLVTVGGTVSGLNGSVVVQNNGADSLTVTANGSFAFPTALTANIAAYDVTVLTQPAGQNCTVANRYGIVSSSNVTNVTITCAPMSASTLALFAGNMGGPGTVDGTGAAAQFFLPQGMASDGAGNLYVADTNNHTIRKITPAGVVSTLAGVPRVFGSSDGVGAAARFNFPLGVAMDGIGNLYVADAGNGTIRRIAPSGMVSTLAGTAGTFGSSDGTGAAARFNWTTSLATDSAGNVYVADSRNSTIRKITPAGVVSTVAGTAGAYGSADGTGAAARFDWPRGVAVDSAGTVYVADEGNCAIRKITLAGVVTTVAGGSCTISPRDGKGTAATFNDPVGLTIDRLGNLYVADWQYGSSPVSYSIRKITPDYAVTTLAVQTGGGVYDGWPYIPQGVTFLYPMGVATDSTNNVYVADPTNSVIRKITPAGVVSTFAGSVYAPGSADGTGAAAQFQNSFGGVATDSTGNVYVADDMNDTIRMITPAGVVSTLAGTAGNYGSADGTGAAAQFEGPRGVATDSAGNVYVADTYNNTIRKITPAGVVSTLAGAPGTSGSTDGTGAAAQFNSPSGVATDSAGSVYVADSGNHTVRKITPAGLVTTLAGTPGISGSLDGVGAAAQFGGPGGIATDSAGNVYVADGSAVRKITAAGAVSTIAAAADSPLATSGVPTAAGFFAVAVAVDSAGNVYVANGWDIRNNWNSFIYEISTAGVISTIAGVAGQMGFQPGTAPGVIAYPVGIAVSGSSLYIVMQNGIAVLQGI